MRRPAMLGVIGLLVGVASGFVQTCLSQRKKPFRDEVKVAKDGVTKGWLIEYPWPDREDASQNWRTLAGKLVLARHGHVIRKIEGGATFWSWNFWADGKQVVYETGPVHGVTGCVRMEVLSGRILEEWPGDCRDLPNDAPDWVKAASGSL